MVGGSTVSFSFTWEVSLECLIALQTVRLQTAMPPLDMPDRLYPRRPLNVCTKYQFSSVYFAKAGYHSLGILLGFSLWAPRLLVSGLNNCVSKTAPAWLAPPRGYLMGAMHVCRNTMHSCSIQVTRVLRLVPDA